MGNINEGVPAVLRYKVRIMDNTVKTGDMIPTNGKTTFTYTDYLSDSCRKMTASRIVRTVLDLSTGTTLLISPICSARK